MNIVPFDAFDWSDSLSPSPTNQVCTDRVTQNINKTILFETLSYMILDTFISHMKCWKTERY